MNSHTHNEQVTAALHVRSLAPRSGQRLQESAIDRLDRLESHGRIETFEVDVWGRQVSLSSAAARTDAGQFVLDRVEEFRDWAHQTGRSLDSFFETRRVESSVTGESYVALVLPMLTLAEYYDDELVYVAPSSDGNSVTTVADRLDTLESDVVTDPDLLRGSGQSPVAAEEAEE